MKKIKTLYSKQISKVFSLMRKIDREKNVLTIQRLTRKLMNAQFRAREIDAMRNGTPQMEAAMLLFASEAMTVKQSA